MKSYKSKKPGIGPDDVSFDRSSRQKQADRKSAQLCQQVMRIVGLSLSGECADPVLQSVVIDSVRPAPDSSRLLIMVIAPGHASSVDVMRRLLKVQAWLRREVAAGVVRKRAPELVFAVIGGAEVTA